MAYEHKKHPFLTPQGLFIGLATGFSYAFFSSLVGDLAIPLIVALLLPAVGLMKTKGDHLALAIFPLLIAIPLGLASVLQCALTVISPCLILGRLGMLHTKKEGWMSVNRLTGALGIYAVFLCVVGLVAWYGLGLSEHTLTMIQQHFDGLPLEVQGHRRTVQVLLTKIWPYIPGIYAGSFTLLFSVGVSVAQKNPFSSLKVLAVKFPRPPLILSELYVPWFFWKVFAGVGGIAALSFMMQWDSGALIFSNLSLALLGVFVLQGMAVVMAFAKKQKNAKMFLVVFYAFVVLVGWMLIFVVIIGLFEPWVNLRSRLKSDDDAKPL